MAAKLIIAPEVDQDINDAYAWYEGRRAGLGEEFLGCVDACIQAICRNPVMHAFVFENYRRGLVRRFPFKIQTRSEKSQKAIQWETNCCDLRIHYLNY
jgi:hypothetical protein